MNLFKTLSVQRIKRFYHSVLLQDFLHPIVISKIVWNCQKELFPKILCSYVNLMLDPPSNKNHSAALKIAYGWFCNIHPYHQLYLQKPTTIDRNVQGLQHKFMNTFSSLIPSINFLQIIPICSIMRQFWCYKGK